MHNNSKKIFGATMYWNWEGVPRPLISALFCEATTIGEPNQNTAGKNAHSSKLFGLTDFRPSYQAMPSVSLLHALP
jgi:hypothetical protein